MKASSKSPTRPPCHLLKNWKRCCIPTAWERLYVWQDIVRCKLNFIEQVIYYIFLSGSDMIMTANWEGEPICKIFPSCINVVADDSWMEIFYETNINIKILNLYCFKTLISISAEIYVSRIIEINYRGIKVRSSYSLIKLKRVKRLLKNVGRTWAREVKYVKIWF